MLSYVLFSGNEAADDVVHRDVQRPVQWWRGRRETQIHRQAMAAAAANWIVGQIRWENVSSSVITPNQLARVLQRRIRDRLDRHPLDYRLALCTDVLDSDSVQALLRVRRFGRIWELVDTDCFNHVIECRLQIRFHRGVVEVDQTFSDIARAYGWITQVYPAVSAG